MYHKLKVSEFDGKVYLRAPFFGESDDVIHEVQMTSEQYRRWIDGGHIQDVCPKMSVDDREFLMSGISPSAWDDIFKDEDN